MKKIIYISFILGLQSGVSQISTSTFFDDLYIGLNGSGNYIQSDVNGLSNFFHDFKYEKNSKDELDFGFGINLSKQVLPFLNLGLEYSRGNLTGTEPEDINVGFSRHVNLKYYYIQFNSKLYLNRLFSQRLKATELNVFLVGGIGVNNAKGKVYRINDNGTSNKELEYQTENGLLTSLGFGLDMKMSRRLDFEVGLVKYFTSDNSLDGVDYRLDVNSSNDQFYKLYLGVNVLLGSTRKTSKRWGKTYGKVNYSHKRVASKPKPEPKLVSKVTKIEKRGTKTIVYADGKVEEIKPENDIAKISSYTVSLKKDSVLEDPIVSEEIADVQFRKAPPIEIVEKEIPQLKIEMPTEKVNKKVEFEEVNDLRNETETVIVQNRGVNKIDNTILKPVLRKSKIVESIIDEEEREEHPTVVINTKHIDAIPHKKNSDTVEKSKIKMNEVSLIDETIIVENNIEINNDPTELPFESISGYNRANEVTIDEAIAIQNSYVASVSNEKPSFIVNDNIRFISKKEKYRHKEILNGSSNLHTITGESLSKKENAEIAKELNVSIHNSELASKTVSNGSSINKLETITSKHKYLYKEGGLGYITDNNVEVLDVFIETLKTKSNLLLILEKEETSSASVNKKNSKRVLKLLNYLQNKRDVDESLIRVKTSVVSSEKEQKKMKVYTIRK